MIVKSLPRKTPSFGQLLLYINAPAETGPAIFHNLQHQVDDLEGVESEFRANSRLLAPRKNGNYLYHEILSLGVDDAPLVTPELLEDITRTYLTLRAPQALAYAKAHLESANPHVHLMISANTAGSSKRLRLSRQQFQRVKRQLEQYQREHYPHLTHSLVFDQPRSSRRPKRIQQRRAESERARRLKHEGKPARSRKEALQSTILTELTTASSGQEFSQQLQTHGLRLSRRGRHIAVQEMPNGKRYRLRTLGLETSFQKALSQWRTLPRRLDAIQAAERSEQRIQDQGVRQELQRLFGEHQRGRSRETERDVPTARQHIREPP